ncbi:MAG: inositol monophosphatase [Nanoarchaeota archaeon]|nr:inositol monophosphatase [DPANN group archaeon]MBL7116539.1 inositol monophosphatase [Nanoarchaeota archaeon]
MSKELEIAKEIALKAGKLIMDFYNKKDPGIIEDKGGFYQNYLTEADQASEKLIFEELKKHFPNYGFIGEETANESSDKKLVWIVDPIDGTKGFVNKTDQFGVQIGLARNGEVILGVVYLPALKKLFHAKKGKGAFLNDKRIHVSKIDRIEDFRVGISRRALHDKNLHMLFDKIKGKEKEYADSIAYKWSKIAEGESEVSLVKKRASKEWDLCAPAIIVQEAGGKVTTFSGKYVTFNKEKIDYPEGIIASNNTIHEDLLKLFN